MCSSLHPKEAANKGTLQDGQLPPSQLAAGCVARAQLTPRPVSFKQQIICPLHDRLHSQSSSRWKSCSTEEKCHFSYWWQFIMRITVCIIKKEDGMFWEGKTIENKCQLSKMETNMNTKIHFKCKIITFQLPKPFLIWWGSSIHNNFFLFISISSHHPIPYRP